jgi:hypothetical protein
MMMQMAVPGALLPRSDTVFSSDSAGRWTKATPGSARRGVSVVRAQGREVTTITETGL